MKHLFFLLVFLQTTSFAQVMPAEIIIAKADGRFKVEAGKSFIEFARFRKDSLPLIESVNCYGASIKPGSKYYTDQMHPVH